MKKVTLIPGDGIGPEIADALVAIFEAAKVPIVFERVEAGKVVYDTTGVLIPEDVYQSIERTNVAIKGPTETPIGYGFSSMNVGLRRKYDLYANIRPIKSINGVETRYENLDLTIFRENTEGLYIGEESYETEDKDVAVAIKRISQKGSYRIIKAAFDYAQKHSKEKVTIVHKANILKLTDGLFLETARQVAKDYPGIFMEEIIVDNMCMQLVTNPEQFQVIVTMNLYGDILSDLCAGLVGGLGLAAGANIGEDVAIFEAVHGSAPDIAGQDKANPLAFLYSGLLLLDYLELFDVSERIRQAIDETLSHQELRTADLGGSLGTSAFTKAIIDRL
ncbi:isocitrate/isopropylmalate dehydrogenase family protein [Streptococcus pluranimalium]|nr:NAD-dependent isocitrate dehydrogenase [Streptococcus suis]